MDHLLPWLRLQLKPGLGRAGLIRLIEHYGTPQSALDAAEGGWPKLPGLRGGLAKMAPAVSSPVAQDACKLLDRMGGWLLTLWDDGYPHVLRHLADPPAILYGCGSWPEGPALAIVGTATRRNSAGVSPSSWRHGCRQRPGPRHRRSSTSWGTHSGGRTLAVLGCG